MASPKHLKKNFITAALILLMALVVVTVSTFAWYIYNANAHTTNVHMVAGAGVSLQISSDFDGPYGSAAILDEFQGTLNPVSTDNILNGFQKVKGFTNGKDNQPSVVANLFGQGNDQDYYKTQLYFRTNGQTQNIYISDIGYEDSDVQKPISTAIRVGFVVHRPGNNQPADPQKVYVFSINEKQNPFREYNTASGQEGYVLDSTRTDGTTVPFTPYDNKHFCVYDNDTGAVSFQPDTLPLCEIAGGGSGNFGTPVQIDIYIWLEGCDADCTNSLSQMTLRNLALSFAAAKAE